MPKHNYNKWVGDVIIHVRQILLYYEVIIILRKSKKIVISPHLLILAPQLLQTCMTFNNHVYYLEKK